MSAARVMIAVVLLLSATIAAQPASAITIPTDSELILNYDLTSQTPPPPYDTLAISIEIGDYSGQLFFVNIYPELNGGGTVFFSLGGNGSGSPVFVDVSFVDDSASDPVLDGVFSIGFRTEPAGDVFASLVSATAVGSITGDGSTPPVSGEVVTGVPEPGTLSLLGLGLVGVAAWRRRASSATAATRSHRQAH